MNKNAMMTTENVKISQLVETKTTRANTLWRLGAKTKMITNALFKF